MASTGWNKFPLHDFPGGAANKAGAVTTDVAGSVMAWRSYTACSATSGTSYGARFQHYVTGAGGAGAALRAYAQAYGAAAANLYGIEVTAEINSATSSGITGELCAIKATSTVSLTTSGTVNPLNLTINTASGKTMHGNSAFICVANAGSGTDIPTFLYVADARGAAGAAALVNTDHANDIVTGANVYLRCADPTGVFYLLGTTTAPAAS